MSERALVELRGAGVTFGERALFAGTDLAVRRGEVVCIVGDNGSGKSTLLRCLAGLQPHTGTRVLGDRPPPTADRSLRRAALAVPGATVAVLTLAALALAGSTVAFNFVDYLAMEGTCDPTRDVACEPSLLRAVAGSIGTSPLHALLESTAAGLAAALARQTLQTAALAASGTAALLWGILLAGLLTRGRATRRFTRAAVLGTAGGLALTAAAWALDAGALAAAAWWLALPVALTHALNPVGPRLGYVPQRLGLVERSTALDNVLHGLLGARTGLGHLRTLAGTWTASERQAAAAALERIGIADLADRRVESLSGGERRRVAVARALVRQADLLLADELLSEIDAASIEGLVGHLRHAAEQSTAVVFVEHDLERAHRAADRVLRLTPTGLEPA